MKTIVIYFSHTHNNEKLAHDIAHRVKSSILKIEDQNKRTGFTILLDILFNRSSSIKTEPCPLQEFDHAILIAPVWAGRIASPMKAFLKQEASSLRSYSFISLCGGVEGQRPKLERQLKALAGKAPQAVEELWIADIVTDKKQFTSAYKVDEKELAKFNEKIVRFLTRKGMPLAPALQSENVY